MELSLLPGKPVFSPAGEALGYVKCAYVCRNFGKISALACVGSDEEEFVLPASAVRSVGDAVLAGSARLNAPTGLPSPVGRGVFDENGNFLGGAALFDVEKGLLTVVKDGARVVIPAAFLSVDGAVIVHKSAEHKPAPRKRNAHKNAIRIAKTPAPPVRTEPLVFQSLPAVFPSAQPAPGANLLGRTVKKTVFCGNVPLARAGETITPALLKKARENNRLLELAANTLTE